MKSGHLQITVTTEIHQELTIRVEDYISGDYTIQKHLELFADVKENPVKYIEDNSESTSEKGDIRHSRVEHIEL